MGTQYDTYSHRNAKPGYAEPLGIGHLRSAFASSASYANLPAA